GEKPLDVPLFGPTHVGERIVVPVFFVIGIVSAWAIRHRDRQRQFAQVERLPGNVETSHANNYNATLHTRDLCSQLNRLIRISGGGNHNSVSATATRPTLDQLRRVVV